MGKKRIHILLSLFLSGIFILPFMYVSRFVILNLDDFCRATLDLSNYLTNIKSWYLDHNGRFVNAILTLLPVYQLSIYRLVITIQFLVLGFFFFRFLSSTLRLYKVEVNVGRKIFLTVLLYIVMLALIPSVFDLFYWYASVTVYLFSLYFFLLFIQNSLKFYFTGELNFFRLLIFSVLCVGNNEMLIGVVNLVLGTLLLVHYRRSGTWNLSLLFLNCSTLIASMVVIFAPGTNTRREQFYYGGNLVGSLKVGLEHGGKFLLENFFSFPYFLFYLFLFIVIYKNTNKSKKSEYLHPVWLLGITYAGIALIFFTLFYATGTLEVWSGRIGSFVSSWVLVLLTLNIINFAVFARLRFKNILPAFKARYSYIFVLLLLISIGVQSNNYVKLRKDLTEDNLPQFNKAFQNRLQRAEQVQNDTLKVKEIKASHLLRSGDVDIATKEWVRECYIQYLNDNNHSDIKNIKIEF